MRPWLVRHASLCRHHRFLPFPQFQGSPHLNRFVRHATQTAHDARESKDNGRAELRYDIGPWSEALDRLLFPQTDNNRPTAQDALQAAAFISEARRRFGHDLLSYMAQQGRWDELVSAIEDLIKHLWRSQPANSWRPLESPLVRLKSLHAATEAPIELAVGGESRTPPLRTDSLDVSLTADHPLDGSSNSLSLRGHQFLGQVWQSIGKMIIDDAKSGKIVSRGILEIIALLHRAGIMPDTIYQYSPNVSSIAGSQPPTLHLLSSQILANLSHAAWNARQAAALAEHQQSNGADAGPEVVSSAFRISIPTVRHELWLELVLWSCLHGGWTVEGASILETLVRETKPAWSPLSWRETVHPMVKAGEEGLVDWSKVGYLLNMGRDQESPDQKFSSRKIAKTISSEVISAYVDALVSTALIGIPSFGVSTGRIVNLLKQYQAFLRRGDYSLESTSWDTVVQQLLEADDLDVESAPGVAKRILDLSSTYDEYATANHGVTRDQQWRPLAPYLIDRSALPLGVFHRILRAHVQRGDFAAAFRTFRELQSRIDRNKELSIAAFFQHTSQPPSSSDSGNFDFRGRYTAQHDPSFYPLIPRDLMADLLDLVTEVGAYDFGSWLLASLDVDGPVIGLAAFNSMEITPSLIRFLVAIRDTDVLSGVLTDLQTARGRNWPSPPFLLSVLDSQVALNNVQGAQATVDRLLSHKWRGTIHTTLLVAILARATLEDQIDAQYAVSVINFVMRSRLRPDREAQTGIAALLMPSTEELRLACLTRNYDDVVNVSPHTRSFNHILSGLVTRYGSRVGQDYIHKFCSSSRSAGQSETQSSEQWLPQNTIDFSISTEGSDQTQFVPEVIHFRGYFKPAISSIRIFLRKRVQELLAAAHSNDDGADRQVATAVDLRPQIEQDDMVQWAIAMLEELQMTARDIEQEVYGSYGDVSILQPGAEALAAGHEQDDDSQQGDSQFDRAVQQ